jgi:hypothetical protein
MRGAVEVLFLINPMYCTVLYRHIIHIAALIPWVKIFINEGSASATAETASPSHAHIETDGDGRFQSVTVVYARACELVRQHGLAAAVAGQVLDRTSACTISNPAVDRTR